jgi:hypothetical protein
MIPEFSRFITPDLHRFATSRLRRFMITDLHGFATSSLHRFMIPDLSQIHDFKALHVHYSRSSQIQLP